MVVNLIEEIDCFGDWKQRKAILKNQKFNISIIIYYNFWFLRY